VVWGGYRWLCIEQVLINEKKANLEKIMITESQHREIGQDKCMCGLRGEPLEGLKFEHVFWGGKKGEKRKAIRWINMAKMVWTTETEPVVGVMNFYRKEKRPCRNPNLNLLW